MAQDVLFTAVNLVGPDLFQGRLLENGADSSPQTGGIFYDLIALRQ